MNAQIIQQQNLVKFKDLYTFLAKNNTQLADDIGQAYINTMRWYYMNNFTRYQEALNKISIIRIGSLDMLGTDPAAPRRTHLILEANHC